MTSRSSWLRILLDAGDPCRAANGAPARYIGRGWCLYISASDSSLGMDLAKKPKGNEHKFPLPTDAEVIAAILRDDIGECPLDKPIRLGDE